MAPYIFVSKGELNGKNRSNAFLFLSGDVKQQVYGDLKIIVFFVSVSG